MFPALHIGRDAPLGVALILHLLATSGVTVAELVDASPRYTIVKAKGPRGPELGPLYDRLRRRFADATADDRDGLRLVVGRPLAPRAALRHRADRPTDRRGARRRSEAEALVAAGRELLQ